MIDSIELTAFKRFSHLRIKLGTLTMLTGLNGSGKSTVIQSLLLAHRASSDPADTVPLSAEWGLDLGQATDLLNINAESSDIGVVIEGPGRHQWVLDTGAAGENDVPYLQVTARPADPPHPVGSAGSAFTFLAAERLGPRTSHPIAPSKPDDAVVGADGRFVAHALAVCPRRDVAKRRRHPGAGDMTTLLKQTEAWLAELVGPIQLDASLVPRTSIATLRIRTPGRMGEWMLPTNTGFGVSYSLPVVVGGLLIPEGGLFLVDSPEAHLHPAAQSAVGSFLATVAASGVQVIVETHSDHVMNGVRKTVAGGTLGAAGVRIHYFGNSPEAVELTVDRKGAVNDWPPGFFDQIDTDLAEIIRSRRA